MKLTDIFNKLIKSKKPAAEPSDVCADELYELGDVKRDEDSDPFLHSLKVLTPDDIAPKPEKKKYTPAEIISEVIRRVIVIACACVFAGSAATLVRSFVDYKRSDDIYGAIADNIFDSNLGSSDRAVSLAMPSRASSALPDYYTGLTADEEDLTEELSSSSYNIKFEHMKNNLTYLKSENPDIFGYINIEGTAISFPIVQSDDNEYYLDHAYNGDYLIVGSIFADFRAKPNMNDNRNTVFYGHNAQNGSMFNNVMNFLDESVFNSTLIEIYTFDGIYTYEPFSIYSTISTYQYFRMGFQNDEEFVAFCEEMQSNSLYNKNMTFTGSDHIITLSTCTNMSANGRYALHAKLVKVER